MISDIKSEKQLPFTEKTLVGWAGRRKYEEGKMLFEKGLICDLAYDHPIVSASIERGNRFIKTSFRLLEDGSAESLCPCYDNRERGIMCSHVMAAGIALIRSVSDPYRRHKLEEEHRKTRRQEQFDESQYITRASEGAPNAVPASLVFRLSRNWVEALSSGSVPLECFVSIEGGGTVLADRVDRSEVLSFSNKDESLLFVWEDICAGPACGARDVAVEDFVNILNLLEGRSLFIEGETQPCSITGTPMKSRLFVDLDHENGELLLRLHTELPFHDPALFPVYIAGFKNGWVYSAGHFWPLEQVLPQPLRSIYLDPIAISRESVPRFLEVELPALEQCIAVENEVTADLFSITPAHPRFMLLIKGSPASLSGVLYAVYENGVRLVAGRPSQEGHFAIPNPEDLLGYSVRNFEAEGSALQFLERHGLSGSSGDELGPVVGCREVLNFLAKEVPALRRRGWRVTFAGRVEPFFEKARFITPVIHVDESARDGWFHVRYEYEDDQQNSLSPVEIQRAIRMGESYVEKHGTTYLLDSGAVEDMANVFADCMVSEGRDPGSFLLPAIYSGYVKSSLDALDGVDVEASVAWMSQAEALNRSRKVDPCQIPEAIAGVLRSYQTEGVEWLRYLETHGFCGILADEMGLGKTLQTLVWLSLPRHLSAAAGQPALIVCPTSLVENWAEEASRFMPQLRVLMMAGAERHTYWEQCGQYDLVITSYALMRRDVEKYAEKSFAAVVLDEAQHIKNHSTQNARAAKKLVASHRLVLTGTPIENGVSDIWSIMDFLMPGYLGSHEKFRKHYELPIAREDDAGEMAQLKLRRKLKPFILRRMKADVAKELPPKIERIATCTMSSEQQALYKGLLEESRRKINSLVDSQGFNRARMEILKVLLRLRQTCCHTDLLKLENLEINKPSAKMDLFFELLDEALDGGHRVLVFSQFVSMLQILRRELVQRQIRYSYLDGSTKNRMQIVREFNTDRTIPLFLISLKAGGTGLNLTGADMVIHYDPWWNPAVENQATDRAYRIGQKKTVYSVKLITRHSVEEKVLAMQQRKKRVIDAALEQDGDVTARLTWDEVKEMLEF